MCRGFTLRTTKHGHKVIVKHDPPVMGVPMTQLAMQLRSEFPDLELDQLQGLLLSGYVCMAIACRGGVSRIHRL